MARARRDAPLASRRCAAGSTWTGTSPASARRAQRWRRIAQCRGSARRSKDFESTIAAAYAAKGEALELGKGVLDGKVAATAVVQIPLRMMNRHGLIAGATGTGKTKGLQSIAEQLSEAGVPVFAADMKGDGEDRRGRPSCLRRRQARRRRRAAPRFPGAPCVLPVPVAPAIRPWRFIIRSGIWTSASGTTFPVEDPAAELERGGMERMEASDQWSRNP